MKTLKEKKLLVDVCRALGQEVDPALLESIRVEEQLTQRMFKGIAIEKPLMMEDLIHPDPIDIPLQEEVVVVAEEYPNQPPSPFPIDANPSSAEDIVQKTVSAISNSGNLPKPYSTVKKTVEETEIQLIRRQLNEILQHMRPLSWGSGGGGSVLIKHMSDFDQYDPTAFTEGKVMRWTNGMFRLSYINSYANTTAVTSNNYTVVAGDYYIGVNYNGLVDIYLPSSAGAGEQYIVKDESGKAQLNPIHVNGTIDNDSNGATIKINNGALHFLWRDGSWRII